MHSNQPTSTESTDPSLMVANVPCVRCCYMQLWVSVSSHDTCRSDTIILHFSEVNWETEFYMTCPDHVTNKAQSARILNQMGSRGQDPHLSRIQWPYLLPSRGSQDLRRDKTRPREIIETLLKSLQCLMAWSEMVRTEIIPADQWGVWQPPSQWSGKVGKEVTEPERTDWTGCREAGLGCSQPRESPNLSLLCHRTDLPVSFHVAQARSHRSPGNRTKPSGWKAANPFCSVTNSSCFSWTSLVSTEVLSSRDSVSPEQIRVASQILIRERQLFEKKLFKTKPVPCTFYTS